MNPEPDQNLDVPVVKNRGWEIISTPKTKKEKEARHKKNKLNKLNRRHGKRTRNRK